MRALATVEKIVSITPIPNADAIECATVRGWQTVVKKGEFAPGDLCVFFEIDSFLPESDPRYAFLMNKAIKWEGDRGVRLRTLKLRGQWSQGLALPISQFPEIVDPVEGQNVTDLLGIKKWEQPIPLALQGKVSGSFPSFLRKTDQERVQNIWEKITAPERMGWKYEISLKLDGSSMTCYLTKEGKFGVCSRNYDLAETPDNAFWACARREGIEEKLRKFVFDFDYPEGIAIQGELIGPGIQGNQERLKEQQFFVFDVFLIESQRYLSSMNRRIRVQQMGLNHVPIGGVLWLNEEATLEEIIALADGDSLTPGVMREGLVFKALEDPSFSFKAVSNKWLLENNL